MTRIVEDLEHGSMILIHDLAKPPTDGESVPAAAIGTVASLATRLGMDAAGLTPVKKGWLFDLVSHVVEALSDGTIGAGHAQAGTPPPDAQQAAQTPAQSATAPETEVSTENPSGGSAAAAPETEVTAPAAPPAETEAQAPAAPEVSGLDDVVARAQKEFGGSATPTA